MPTMSLLFYGLILPGIVAGVFTWIGRRFRRSAAASAGKGIGFALLAGYVGLVDWPAWPPNEATQWLVLIAPLLGGVVGLSAWWSHRPVLRWGLRFITTAVLLFLLLGPMREYHWTSTQGVVWMVALGAVVLWLWRSTETLTQRCRSVGLVMALLSVAIFSAIALAASGSILLGQMAGMLAAGLGSTLIFSAGALGQTVRSGAATVTVILLGAVIGLGYFYSALPASSALLLVAAMCTPWVVEQARFETLDGAWRMLFQVSAAAAPALFAAGLAFWLTMSSHSSSYY
ncbi:MAG: hypothetical protein R3C68_04510 [Myxococcota bacterium]